MRGLAWSPDSQLIATGGDSGSIYVWRVDATAEAEFVPSGNLYGIGGYHLVGHTSAISGLHWSPLNDWLVSIGEDNRVIVWDGATGQRLAQVALDFTPTAVQWSPISSIFTVADTTGHLHVYVFGEDSLLIQTSNDDE
jgi:WD40 repeat protein